MRFGLGLVVTNGISPISNLSEEEKKVIRKLQETNPLTPLSNLQKKQFIRSAQTIGVLG